MSALTARDGAVFARPADQRRGRAAARTRTAIGCGDEGRPASTEPLHVPGKSSPRSSSLVLDLDQGGSRIHAPDQSLPRRAAPAAMPRQKRCCAELGAIDCRGRSRRTESTCQPPLPPGSPAWGGRVHRRRRTLRPRPPCSAPSRPRLADDVDLRHASTACAGDRFGRRAETPRHGGTMGRSSVVGRVPSLRGGFHPRPRVPEGRQETRRGDRRFLLANGRGAQVDPAPPSAASPICGSRDWGSPRKGMCWRAIRLPRSKRACDRIEAKEELTFRRGREHDAAGGARLRRDCACGAEVRGTAEDEAARVTRRDGYRKGGLDRLLTKARTQWARTA